MPTPGVQPTAWWMWAVAERRQGCTEPLCTKLAGKKIFEAFRLRHPLKNNIN